MWVVDERMMMMMMMEMEVNMKVVMKASHRVPRLLQAMTLSGRLSI